MAPAEYVDAADQRRTPTEPPRSAATGQPESLPPGVQQRVTAPPPLALLLGTFTKEPLIATLDRLGCAHMEQTQADMIVGAQSLANFELIFVGTEQIADEGSIHAIREVQALNPNAKVILLCRTERMTPALLVTAMQVGISDVADCHDVIALSTSIDKVLRAAEARAERVLAIGAHPDDIEIGCGGTLLDHRRRGDNVSVLTMSRGAIGGDQAERVLEATATATSMGAQLMMADLPDTCVDPGIETIRMIEAVVKMVEPTIVYVHSKHDNHQDHRAVHAAVVSATRGVPQVFAFQSPSATNDFSPTKFVAIDEVIVRKVEILGLFESQRERPYLEPDMVIASARYWARNLAPRAWYAEPFELLRSLTRTRPQAPSKPAPAQQGRAQVLNLHQR